MNTEEAFETLLGELRAALKEAQQAASEALRRSDFSAAREATGKCETIQKKVDQLEAMRKELLKLTDQPPPARTRKKTKPARAPKGSKTPQGVYRIPILQALVEMGGEGSVGDVLDRVYTLVEHRLTELDKGTLPSGRDIRWRNTAMWERNRMRQDGLLADDSPHGTWEITDKGRRALAEHRGTD